METSTLIKRTAVFIILLLGINSGHAQNNTAIDVLHYNFQLQLSDISDTIKGKAVINLQILKKATAFSFDLANINAEGKGMQVLNVHVGDKDISFVHAHDKMLIGLPKAVKPGDDQTVTIEYQGIPSDGLIIGKSVFNKRTFFGDNWPNRAHYWLPCNDIPADKASLEFIITAPKHYSIVSNGIQIEERLLADSTKLTHWKEDTPLPTKVMVIGAADFAVSDAGYAGNIPVTSWIYTEDKEKGFYDYAKAKDILQYFDNYIGPYGYKKLANVQSKTKFGGMENAGAIFYYEQSVTGKGTIEDLLAHEIAHQWFGDMVTETNFKHIWLSEGFATYFTDIYLESKYGRDSMNHRLAAARDKIIDFAAGSRSAVVDTSSDYMALLNANSYQKGGWILHMLRNTVGDAVFRQVIREYYKKFAGKNASSEDFVAVAENISRKNLKPFFTQWLYQPGVPVVAVNWQYNAVKKNLAIVIEQKQKELFNYPMELMIRTGSGKLIKTALVQKRRTVIIIPSKAVVTEVIPDPGYKLLWQPYVVPVN
jgi:aminopeptidase N